MPLAPIFTPYGWQSVQNMKDLYYGAKHVSRSWSDPAYRNRAKWNLANSPFIGDLWKYEDTQKRMNDYMKAKGIDWADVKYPSLITGAGSATNLVMNIDPKSVERLYD